MLLPTAAAVVMTLAMAGITVGWEPAAKRVVMLLDLSGSTRGCPWRGKGGGGGNWLRGLAELRLGSEKEVTVVGFGGQNGVRVLLDGVKAGDAGSWPSEWSWNDEGGGSDVGAALAWRSEEERREGVVWPRWVLTDGFVTGAKKAQGLQSPPPLPGFIGVTEIASPEVDVGVLEVGGRKAKDGVDIWAHVRATGKTEARLTVLRDTNIVVAGQPVFFDGEGSKWINVHDGEASGEGEGGGHRYEVKIVRAPNADPWPENDVGSFLWMPEDEKGRVLVVGDGGIVGNEFMRGKMEPGNFPRSTGELLAEGWQVIVLNDVEAQKFSGHAVKVLEEFVRDTGGGLVMVGRRNAFGPGRYAEELGGKLEELSAVWSAPRERPAARVVFVLDASGSMNEVAEGQLMAERKFRLVARGVESAMELLKDDDLVTVLTFNNQAEKVAAGRKEELVGSEPRPSESDRATNLLRNALDQVQPTGGTVPDSALELVAEALGENKPRAKDTPPPMVVLLTDGEIPAMDVSKWKLALQKAGAKMTVVAPPSQSSDAVLGQLAKEVGATWLNGENAGAWAGLLKRALAEELMGRAMTTELRWKSDDEKLTGTTREWIEVWKKAESKLVASSDDRCLAATAQRGLGKVSAVAMGSEKGGEGDALLTRIIKESMPAAGDRRFTLSVRREEEEGGGGWIVRADGIETGKFLDGEKLTMRVVDRGEQRVIDMQQTGAGRYEARVDGGEAFAGVVIRKKGGAKDGIQLVGRILPGKTEVGEWPASVEKKAEFLPPTEKISANETDRRKWKPRIWRWRMDLSRGFWVLGGLLALSSLWVRRGPMGRVRS